ncbi:MAG: PD-(D/E)XK nuclease family protein [archaeon]
MKKEKPKIYSHSRLSTFEQCPYKFKLRYIDKVKPEIEKTIESHLGSAVHDTLEWLYKQVMSKRIPTLDEVINYYVVKWQDSYEQDTLIVKEYLSEKDYFNKGVQFLIDYYSKNHPFNESTLELEKKIILNLDGDNQYQIQGFIDRLVYNPKTQEYEIHDYKTSNSLPTKEKIDSDRQLALYAIAIKNLFGEDKEVKLVWHYLAHNLKIISTRTNEQLAQLKQETLNQIKIVESTTEFQTQKSILCNWCEYKSMCSCFGGKVNYEKKEEIEDYNSEEEICEESKKEELDIW